MFGIISAKESINYFPIILENAIKSKNWGGFFPNFANGYRCPFAVLRFPLIALERGGGHESSLFASIEFSEGFSFLPVGIFDIAIAS